LCAAQARLDDELDNYFSKQETAPVEAKVEEAEQPAEDKKE